MVSRGGFAVGGGRLQCVRGVGCGWGAGGLRCLEGALQRGGKEEGVMVAMV